MSPLTEIDVALDSPGEAMTEESEIDEAWTHGDFLGSKRVTVFFGIELF